MTDIIRVITPPSHQTLVIPDFHKYSPEWSKTTMTTVNEMMSQFYGWLPDLPKVDVGGDWVTWVLLGTIAVILMFRK